MASDNRHPSQNNSPPRLRLVKTARFVAGDERSRLFDDVDWSILMARAQEGDGAAYERLLTEITPYLRAICARRQCQTDDIEDIVQDILLSVHGVRATYDPMRPFGPWLVAIANRRITDRIRRLSRRRRVETNLMPVHENVADGQAPADEKVDRRTIAAAIANLPVAQRRAIQLLKLEELSLREAAMKSGLSIASLKVSAHRAIVRLRTIFIGGDEN